MVTQQENSITEFELRILDLHWIAGASDDPNDLCLHGQVFIRIGNEIIHDGIATDDHPDAYAVSAGAYRLLETLSVDHITGNEGDHMLPHCGHFMIIDEKVDRLKIMDCPNGLDWTVTHEQSVIRLTTAKNKQVLVPVDRYREIVFHFADTVKSFYDKCTPKCMPIEDFERAAYYRFWNDWERFRNS